jgi:hypothetical protein
MYCLQFHSQRVNQATSTKQAAQTLKMKVAGSYKITVNFYKTTRRQIPQDWLTDLEGRRRGLKEWRKKWSSLIDKAGFEADIRIPDFSNTKK